MEPNKPFLPKSPESENATPVTPAKKVNPKKVDLQIAKTFQQSKPNSLESVKPLKAQPGNGENTRARMGGIVSKRLNLPVTEPTLKNPFELCSEKMQGAIRHAEKSLHIATTGPTLDERLSHMPEIPGSKGIGGAYFVGPKSARTLLIKPAIQELGMPGCSRDEQSHPAMEPGTGAIRERLAYVLQKESGIAFGIAETTVQLFSHEMLSLPSDVDKALNSLKAFDVLSREQIVHFVKNSPDGTFCTSFAQHLTNTLQRLVPDAELYDKITGTHIDALRTVIRFPPDDLVKCVTGLHTITHNPSFIEQAGMAAYNTLEAGSQTPVAPTLCSAQVVEHECISFDSIAYDEDQTELDRVPKVEFEKLLFDCLVFAMDRHLANVLARKVTVGTLKKRMAHASQDEKVHLQAMVDHAKKIHSPYVYELILIDHGTSLPDPNYRRTDIQPMMDWKYLKLANEKISGATKARILKIDPEALRTKLKEDQQVFEEKYGEFCKVSDATFQFQRFCCMVLQECIRQNMDMSQIAAFYDDSLVSLYEVEVHSKKHVDWGDIQVTIQKSVRGAL